MAADKIQLDASGNRQLDASGNVVLGDTPDPCCCTCPPCGNCVGLGQDTPCKVLLTISGLTLCAICHIDIVPGQYASWAGGASFDGTYCLTQDPSLACNWLVNITGPTLNVYSDNTCTTLLKSITDWTIVVGNGFGGAIGFNCTLFNSTDPDGTRTVINAPAFDAAADCVSGGSGTPTAGVCNAASTNLASAGGTWTATPNGC